jgi:hypothetical protein
MQPMTADEIAGMRETSASALPDECTITRATGEFVLNEATGDSDPSDVATVYTGPCRVRPRGSQEQDVQVGELHETLGPYVGTLPGTVALARQYAAAGVTVAGDPNDVVVDDYLTVTASWDPAMVGRSFQVIHIGYSAWQIDRRIGLEDHEQPKGVEAGS